MRLGCGDTKVNTTPAMTWNCRSIMAEPTTDVLRRAKKLLSSGKYTQAYKILEDFDGCHLVEREKAWYFLLFTEAGLYVGHQDTI